MESLNDNIEAGSIEEAKYSESESPEISLDWDMMIKPSKPWENVDSIVFEGKDAEIFTDSTLVKKLLDEATSIFKNVWFEVTFTY